MHLFTSEPDNGKREDPAMTASRLHPSLAIAVSGFDSKVLPGKLLDLPPTSGRSARGAWGEKHSKMDAAQRPFPLPIDEVQFSLPIRFACVWPSCSRPSATRYPLHLRPMRRPRLGLRGMMAKTPPRPAHAKSRAGTVMGLQPKCSPSAVLVSERSFGFRAGREMHIMATD